MFDWLKVPRFILKLIKEVGQDDLSDAASALAYKFFLALFPFFIFLTALAGFAGDLFGVEDPQTEIMDTLGTALPSDAYAVVNGQVETVVQEKNGALLSFGILGAIWAASSGVGSLIKALNRIHEVKETRPIYKRYGLAVGLTVLAGGFIVSAVALTLAGQFFGEEIAGQVGLEGAAKTLFLVARWPAAVLLLLTAVAFLYWAAPNIDLPFKWLSPGAVLFVCLWLPATFGFGLYVSNFGSYGDTYGALGGVVVLLVWLYLTSFVLLLGAEFNAVLAQETAPREVEARAGEAATAQTARGGKRPEDAGEPEKKRGSFIGAAALKAIGAGVAFWTLRRVAKEH